MGSLNTTIDCMELGQEFIRGGFTLGYIFLAQLRPRTSVFSPNRCRDGFRFSFSQWFRSRVLLSLILEH